MKNIEFADISKEDQIIEKMALAGSDKLHVLADFDGTLTKAFIDGKKVPSIISVLRDGDYLSKEYRDKAHELYDKYSVVESDSNIPYEQRRAAMREWWTKHFELLIKSGLNKNDLARVIESDTLQLREGFVELRQLLKSGGIPLVIISSSGLGGDVIRMYLDKQGISIDNIHIISNVYQWDDKGNAIGVVEPIIHGMNKDETVLKDLPIYPLVKERKNVILLGDSLNDMEMVKGFDYENLLKIGFLNDKVEEKKNAYLKVYDTLILNDGSLEYVNEILDRIIWGE